MTNWRTPHEFFDPLQYILGEFFAVDAAADSSNHLLPLWYGEGSPTGEVDAFKVQIWASPAWCNPPYGKEIGRWLDKFIEQAKLGGTVVALLPANTETRWFYEKVVPFSDVFFLVGRIPFIDPDRTKPTQPDHGSALCLFSPEAEGHVEWLDWRARFADVVTLDTTPIQAE